MHVLSLPHTRKPYPPLSSPADGCLTADSNAKIGSFIVRGRPRVGGPLSSAGRGVAGSRHHENINIFRELRKASVANQTCLFEGAASEEEEEEEDEETRGIRRVRRRMRGGKGEGRG
ncbi:hypothetical protein E2C01_102067 [Portunus trituberculatus]|uniref:Uncharacterized protein n=1 Tax=Portunus trituberculatus TaxID=210409 RepID=A0A5B7KC70_PORTR|nr:hypothetical protein [Portunus trituberculatus]